MNKHSRVVDRCLHPSSTISCGIGLPYTVPTVPRKTRVVDLKVMNQCWITAG